MGLLKLQGKLCCTFSLVAHIFSINLIDGLEECLRKQVPMGLRDEIGQFKVGLFEWQEIDCVIRQTSYTLFYKTKELME
jgi:hypothetical protein